MIGIKSLRLLIGLIVVICLITPGIRLTADQPSVDWPMWGHDLSNTRYNPAESAITSQTIGRLTLRWAFAFPNTTIASSQPTVIGDTVYVGGWNGYVYALDTATGRQRWAFFTGITGKIGVVRVSVTAYRDLILFGDQSARFFAVNRANGTLAWIKTINDHPTAQLTGSPVVYGDRVYIPIASHEENAAAEPTYPCCTFRGGLAALNAGDGSLAWRFYSVDPPQPISLGKTTGRFGPSGVGIWSTPAIDPQAGLIYLSTGNSYSPPVSPYSDAILALNITDGSVRWARQLTAGDWANAGCEAKDPVNCDGDHGQDVDFSSSPLLFSIPTAQGPRKLVGAIQKNGTLNVLDALTGASVWQQTVGEPTNYAWGMAFDGQRLYVGDATYEQNGGVYALDPQDGRVIWQSGPMPCQPGPDQPSSACWSGHMGAATATQGLLWMGAMDGQLRALDAATGKTLWSVNTDIPVINAVNQVSGHGGSIGPTGATVADGQVYVMSGYNAWGPRILPGNVLFVYGLADFF